MMKRYLLIIIIFTVVVCCIHAGFEDDATLHMFSESLVVGYGGDSFDNSAASSANNTSSLERGEEFPSIVKRLGYEQNATAIIQLGLERNQTASQIMAMLYLNNLVPNDPRLWVGGSECFLARYVMIQRIFPIAALLETNGTLGSGTVSRSGLLLREYLIMEIKQCVENRARGVKATNEYGLQMFWQKSFSEMTSEEEKRFDEMIEAILATKRKLRTNNTR